MTMKRQDKARLERSCDSKLIAIHSNTLLSNKAHKAI